MEVWDEVSHFNAKKLYLFKTRKRTDGKIKKDDLVATLKDLYKNVYNAVNQGNPVLMVYSEEVSEKSGDVLFIVKVVGDKAEMAARAEPE